MSESNGERENSIDLYVIQPNEFKWAEAAEWGNGQRWTPINSVIDLVHHVKAQCGDKYYVRLLRIGGHGEYNSFRLGTTRISRAPITNNGIPVTTVQISNLRVWLNEILHFFKADKSFIILDNCLIGNNDLLLRELSEAFGGVPVIAPFDEQFTNEGGGVPPLIEGNVRVCTPYVCLTKDPKGMMI